MCREYALHFVYRLTQHFAKTQLLTLAKQSFFHMTFPDPLGSESNRAAPDAGTFAFMRQPSPDVAGCDPDIRLYDQRVRNLRPEAAAVVETTALAPSAEKAGSAYMGEQAALRASGLIGRAGPYGNTLYAFDYQLLPKEARDVLDNIIYGRPLHSPRHDGKPYGNRSQDLPGTMQYYEYTVPTEGTSTRGERRLVIRGNGVVFFTACHYEREKPTRAAPLFSPEYEAKVMAQPEEWRNGFYVVTGMPPDLRRKVAEALGRVHEAQTSSES